MTEHPPGGTSGLADRYQVLSELGRGGMGVVWLATDRLLDRHVAVKEIRPPFSLVGKQRENFKERALREARTAGRLNHPSVVMVHDVIPATADDDAIYIVMELIQAPDLAKIIETDGPLPEFRVITMATQLLDALQATHALGVVHRDIKPANIMVLPDDRVKLADFGIAHATDDTHLTTSGVIGAAAYIAPELFHGAEPSPACDLWSLGATLYHATHGKGPFDRTTTAATLNAILSEDPPVPHCQPPLSTLITALLTRDPHQRPTIQRAHQLLDPPAPQTHTTTTNEPTSDQPPRQKKPASGNPFSQTTRISKPKEPYKQKATTQSLQHDKDNKSSSAGGIFGVIAIMIGIFFALHAIIDNGDHGTPANTPTPEYTDIEKPQPSALNTPDPELLDSEDTDRTPFNLQRLFPATADAQGHEYKLVSYAHSTCNATGYPAVQNFLYSNNCERMAAGVYRNTHTGLFVSAYVLSFTSSSDATVVDDEISRGRPSAAFLALSFVCPGSGSGKAVCDGQRPGAFINDDAFHRYEIIAQAVATDGSNRAVQNQASAIAANSGVISAIEESILGD